MSLKVPVVLLERAQAGEEKFGFDEIDEIVSDSLPYFHRVVEECVKQMKSEGRMVLTHNEEPPDAIAFAQLLRGAASTPIRTAYEEQYGIKIEFVNCHKMVFVDRHVVGTPIHRREVSMRAQILNQQPGMLARDC